MKTDKKYSRKSIVDSQIYDVNLMVRFAKNKNNEISFDPYLEKPGRGAYCLKNIEQIDTVFKKKLLNRAFRQNVSLDAYDSIRKEVEEWVNKTTKENQM
ncbi:YlxR family protein [Metamycoplasma spumans]|uniref:YlxR family protein n=1 Tax=Metamycoplasma spumans TaxID=92406 RepID=UPI0004816A9C